MKYTKKIFKYLVGLALIVIGMRLLPKVVNDILTGSVVILYGITWMWDADKEFNEDKSKRTM